MAKVLSARIVGDREVQVTQVRDRVLPHGLPAQAPEPLDTVIELQCDGTPRQVLGAGHVLLDQDLWRDRVVQ